MQEVIAIVAVSCVGATMILGTLGGLIIAFIKIIRDGNAKNTPEELEDETRMIQEIYHGLNKMIDRVETLETLLIDDEQKRQERFERKLEEE